MRGQGGGEARDDDTVTLGPSKAALALATREVVERRPRRGGVEGGAWLGLGLGSGVGVGVRVRGEGGGGGGRGGGRGRGRGRGRVKVRDSRARHREALRAMVVG